MKKILLFFLGLLLTSNTFSFSIPVTNETLKVRDMTNDLIASITLNRETGDYDKYLDEDAKTKNELYSVVFYSFMGFIIAIIFIFFIAAVVKGCDTTEGKQYINAALGIGVAMTFIGFIFYGLIYNFQLSLNGNSYLKKVDNLKTIINKNDIVYFDNVYHTKIYNPDYYPVSTRGLLTKRYMTALGKLGYKEGFNVVHGFQGIMSYNDKIIIVNIPDKTNIDDTIYYASGLSIQEYVKKTYPNLYYTLLYAKNKNKDKLYRICLKPTNDYCNVTTMDKIKRKLDNLLNNTGY